MQKSIIVQKLQFLQAEISQTQVLESAKNVSKETLLLLPRFDKKFPTILELLNVFFQGRCTPIFLFLTTMLRKYIALEFDLRLILRFIGSLVYIVLFLESQAKAAMQNNERTL